MAAAFATSTRRKAEEACYATTLLRTNDCDPQACCRALRHAAERSAPLHRSGVPVVTFGAVGLRHRIGHLALALCVGRQDARCPSTRANRGVLWWTHQC